MLTVTAAEIVEAGAGFRKPWSIMAAHLRNEWIGEDSHVGCVLGIDGGVSPLFGAESDDVVEVAHQVRVNVLAGHYREGWIVTREGATLIAMTDARAEEYATLAGVTVAEVKDTVQTLAGV